MSKDINKQERSPFAAKLLSRVRAANRRLATVERIDDLRPQLTMRRIKLDLEPHPVTSDQIRHVREILGVSQGVFAAFIDVPVRSLQDWEQGRKQASGCAVRLIGEMLRDPSYWQTRFREAVETAQ